MGKILFDLTVCQPLGNIKYHGGGTYGYIIFKRLCEKDVSSVIAYIDKSRFIDPSIKECIEHKNIQVIDAHDVDLTKALQNNISLLYSPLFRSEYLKLRELEIPIYITFHGMRKLEMNRDKYEYVYAMNWQGILKSVIKKTPLYNFFYKKFYTEYEEFLTFPNVRIVTVSNHSKNSIRYYYPSLEEKNIEVYYSPSTTINDYQKVEPFRREKYYLIISADRWLKNSFRTLLAFDHIFEKFPEHKGKVVVVGLKSGNLLIRKLKHKERFEVFDYIDRITLESMFCGAYLLAYPSLNEGFGYPPLEAMKYRTPVITSAFSAIAEICDDAVLYTNPYSVDEIAMRILQMENEDLYQMYENKSLERYDYICRKQKEDLDKLTTKLLSFVK